MPLISHYLFSVCRRFHVIFYQFILDSHYFLPVYCWCYIISDQFTAGSPRSGKLRTQKWKSHLVRTQRLNVLPLKSVYSHTCYAYCQGFLSCLFLPLRSIHLHFFQNLSWFLLCWLWPTHGSCIGPKNEIGHPDGCWFPCWVPAESI